MTWEGLAWGFSERGRRPGGKVLFSGSQISSLFLAWRLRAGGCRGLQFLPCLRLLRRRPYPRDGQMDGAWKLAP